MRFLFIFRSVLLNVSYEEDVRYALRMKSIGFSDPLIEAILLVHDSRDLEPKKAIKKLSKAIELLSSDSIEEKLRTFRAHFYRSRAYYSLKDKPKALADIRAAERLLEGLEELLDKEEIGEFFLFKARLSGESGFHRQALEASNKAIEYLTSPYQRAEAYMIKAIALTYLNKVEEAFDTIKEGIRELKKKDRLLAAELYRLKAEILSYLKRDAEAFDEALKAYKIARRYESARGRMIALSALKVALRSALSEKNYSDALKVLSKASNLEIPENDRKEELLKELITLAKDVLEVTSKTEPELTIEVVEKLIERDIGERDKQELLLIAGDAMMSIDPRASIEIFREVLSSDSKYLKARAYLGIANALTRLGKVDLSKKYLDKARKLMDS